MFGAGQVIRPAEPSLPVFSTREIRFRKARDANTLLFFIPAHSSLLLSLLRPVCHAYTKQDMRCLHLLQTVALVPSGKWNKVVVTVTQALKLPVSPRIKGQLEEKLRPWVTKLLQEGKSCPLLCLQLKEAVADCLRCWIDDPVEGFVLRKEHVVNGMRLDDLVATPAGDGYLQGYRSEDGFCTVIYPWGYGIVHIDKVKKVEVPAKKRLKKRLFNEFDALEHELLYEQIERLLENVPSPALEKQDSVKKEVRDVGGGAIPGGVEHFKELLSSLEEEHVDTTVLRGDLGLLRRVQALVNKVKEVCRSQTPQEPERKQVRSHEDVLLEEDQEKADQAAHMQEQCEEPEQ
uniref:Uncharacterized protein n=1 Tax=Hyaloperonospora arabidopsidis (strain Emoy2) TaxID=559515 RepID=M4BTQ0_HYAAE